MLPYYKSTSGAQYLAEREGHLRSCCAMCLESHLLVLVASVFAIRNVSTTAVQRSRWRVWLPARRLQEPRRCCGPQEPNQPVPAAAADPAGRCHRRRRGAPGVSDAGALWKGHWYRKNSNRCRQVWDFQWSKLEVNPRLFTSLQKKALSPISFVSSPNSPRWPSASWGIRGRHLISSYQKVVLSREVVSKLGPYSWKL